MLNNESLQDLLTGGLDDYWKSACRAWIDESKQLYGVKTDLDAIASFSDNVILPEMISATQFFSNTEFLKCDFIGLPTPRFAVLAMQKEGHSIVAIHEGFFRLISFLNEISLLSLTLDRLTHLKKEEVTTLDLQLKKYKIQIAKKFLKEPFRLPSFYERFSDDIKKRMNHEIASMLTFAINHELAHHALGHSSPLINATRRGSPHLIIDESMNFLKEQEFEADEHAIVAVQSNRNSYAAGITLFLYHLALIETYSVETKLTHPLAVNRLEHIRSKCSSSFSEETNAAFDVMANALAEDYKQHREEDLHVKFELLSLADVDQATDDIIAIAKVILEGEHIANKYSNFFQSKTIMSALEGIRSISDDMIFVEGGCFDMGNTFGDGHDDEKPVHEVCVDDFYIGKYPVTQKEWIAVMRLNPSHFEGSEDLPVESVSWDDVQEFIIELNELTGCNFRLPTEAEWEYAARSGGKEEKWSGTNKESKLSDYGWYEDNSDEKTHPVGKKKPNDLGAYDMSGNVSEWVEDLYSEDYYQNSLRENPKGPESGEKKRWWIFKTAPIRVRRVLRGGSWIYGPVSLRAASRAVDYPETRVKGYGFRLSLSV